VILDLEYQEFVNGLYRVGIAGLDANLPAAVRFPVGVADGLMLRLHYRYAGRHLVVNEHGNVEIARGEEGRNVRHVGADLIARGIVMLVPRRHLDQAAVGQKNKVVRRSFLSEAHGMITARIYARSVLIRRNVVLVEHVAAHYRALWVSA